MWDTKYTKPSRVDAVKNKILKCAGAWDFPNRGIAGRWKGHPKRGALLSNSGIDHIFEVVNSIFLGLELGRVESDSDIVERLIGQEADVQFKSDGGEMRDLT